MQPSWTLDLPPHLLGTVARFVARSVERAHQAGPTKWGLTPFADGSMRLNVGYCEVLTVSTAEIRILAIRAHLSPIALEGARVDQRGESFYKRVRDSVIVAVPTITVEAMEQLLSAVAPAHYSAIALAANGPVGGGVKAGHRADAVSEIGRLARVALPLPDRPFPPDITSTQASVESAELFEGALLRSEASTTERNRQARAECLAHFGYACAVCDMSFEVIYGELGHAFIEVHHLDPLSEAQGERRVRPLEDLRPVCANCHRMLHRRQPPIRIADLRAFLRGDV